MLNAAIYGLGNWGARLVDSVQGKSDRIRFVSGISRDPERRLEWSRKTGIALTASFEEVLRDPGIDAVVLTTPHSQHHAQVIAAARAGKHVFVEKPFALTVETAEAALAACRNSGITLGVGFNRRYSPAFMEMMRRIRGGDIGTVLHMEGQHPVLRATRRRRTAGAPAGTNIPPVRSPRAACMCSTP